MNLMDLFIRIGVDDQASNKISKITGAVGKGLATAAKIGAAAVGVAAAGIAALTKASIDQYAEYEQLVGGVETLFKTSSDKVMGYAENAYKTAGLSANEYMATVTSFSASLLQSLGGDTEAAADYADKAITDMSDNANKMGTSMEMIQNAYQGFAKQNYTMLDNLKLGYGGTKTEMERLIADAAKLSDTVDAQSMSFANIVEAVHVVQTEMGITGTTAKEAASTIQGSVASMRSAWKNLVAGMADENANLDALITRLVDSVTTAAKNIVPRISVALSGVAKFIGDVVPAIVAEIPKLINENLPALAKAAVNIVEGLVKGISENRGMLVDTIFDVVVFMSKSFLDMLPQIVQLGLDLIVALAKGIAENLPALIPTIIDVIFQVVEILTDPENLIALVEAAIELVFAINAGITKAIPQLAEGVLKLVGSIVESLFTTDWVQVGKDIISKIWDGWKDGWGSLVSWFKDGVANLFGLSSETSPAPNSEAKSHSHALGLDYVPYDEYPALLHRGEAVLTATEARKWRGDGTYNGDKIDELIVLVRSLLGAVEDGQTIVLNDREVARTVRRYV